MDSHDRYYIKCLIRDIEDKFDRTFKSATDFDRLEQMIVRMSNESINASTLKRIWGYTKTTGKPRRSTLTILARTLGVRDWEEYKAIKGQRTESGFISHTVLNVGELTEGDIISFRWLPDRCITLSFLGNDSFEVKEQENSSLREGDIFRTLSIREGYPIYCTDVIRNQEKLGDYIAGEEHGIRGLKHLRPGRQTPDPGH